MFRADCARYGFPRGKPEFHVKSQTRLGLREKKTDAKPCEPANPMYPINPTVPARPMIHTNPITPHKTYKPCKFQTQKAPNCRGDECWMPRDEQNNLFAVKRIGVWGFVWGLGFSVWGPTPWCAGCRVSQLLNPKPHMARNL